MHDPGAEAREDPARRSFYQVWGLVLALLGVMASILIPFAVEVFKDRSAGLTLRTVANRPLVTLDPQRAGDIRLTFDGAAVETPWLLSLSLENNSDLPVDAADIREPLTIVFDGARLLRATITDRRPAFLRAELQAAATQVSLTFNLLNRGESVAIDLLFDREPRILREFVHLKGGEPLRRIVDAPATAGRSVTWPALPSFPTYFALVAASLGAILMIGVGAAALIQEVGRFGRTIPAIGADGTLDAILRARQPAELIDTILLRAGLPGDSLLRVRNVGLDLADALTLDEATLTARLAARDDMAHQGLSPAEAVARYRGAIVTSFRERLAVKLHLRLPHPIDRQVRAALEDLPAEATPERVLAEAQDQLHMLHYVPGRGAPARRVSRFDREDVTVVVTTVSAMVAGLASLSLALAAWRQALGA
jgi:hypothetical protein